MNKSIKTKISLLPLFIVLGVLAVIYFVFLKNSDLLKFNKPPEVKRLNGFPTVVYTTKEIDKKREVITNQEQLANFLNEIDESGYLIVRENIDFNKEILIGVTNATKEEEGFEIKVKKIYEDKENKTLLVSVEETELDDACEKTLNKNIVVDLIAINKTDRKIDFERIKKYKECEVRNAE